MTIWRDGKKQKVTKYLLTMFMKEAYALFKSDNPDVTVGFSKFSDLRPENVMLMKDTPLYQCKCETHENYLEKIIAAGLKYPNN